MSKIKCKACDSKGYLLIEGGNDVFEVQRCDVCHRFKGDLDASVKFFKDHPEYTLIKVSVERKEQT